MDRQDKLLKLRNIFKGMDEEVVKTNSISLDEYRNFISTHKLIAPEYSLYSLAKLAKENCELPQCIESMEVNISSVGNRLEYYTENNTSAKEKEPTIEKVKIKNFLKLVNEDFTAFRRALTKDLEYTGNAFFEVLRSPSGLIQEFIHLKSISMFLTNEDPDQTLYTRSVHQLDEQGLPFIKKVDRYKRFRRYVQNPTIGTSSNPIGAVFFKEFLDPRPISKYNGEPLEEGKYTKEDLATEVIHIKIYDPVSAYGMPRWNGQTLTVLGENLSEKINYSTFKNNNIPSYLITVANGRLTDESLDNLIDHFEKVRSENNWSRAVIVEAEGMQDSEESGTQKIELHKMQDGQTGDAMFQNYSKENRDKIRRGFRLPPVIVGRSDDYSRATAETSKKLADEQVFQPEKQVFDNLMNDKIFTEMGFKYWKFITNAPTLTDSDVLGNLIASAERSGAMNPKLARKLLEKALNVDLPEFLDDDPVKPNTPFTLTVAEAVKNQSQPTSMGQITAVKSMTEGLYTDVIKMIEDEIDAMTK